MPILSAKRAMMEQLVADGVTHVFGNPGSTELGFLDLLQDYPKLEFILGLQEVVPVAMADAYARVTRRPALVQLHAGPGLGNGVGQIRTAKIGHSPLVVFTGNADSRTFLHEPVLGGDLVELARPVTKWSAQVNSARDVPQALRRAFKVAEEPPQGPVFLSLPVDVMEGQGEMGIAPTRYTPWRTRPAPEALRAAADLIASARRPMVMVGDGVCLCDAQAEASALAELLGAPVFECYAADFNISHTHPLYVGSIDFTNPRAVRALTADCDVLVVLGGKAFHLKASDPEHDALPPSVRIAHFHVDPWELGKNQPTEAPVLGDVKQACAELIALLQPRLDRRAVDARRAQAEQKIRDDRERSAAARRVQAASQAVPMATARVMAELAAALPDNALVFSEALSNQAPLDAAIVPEGPLRSMRTRGAGAIGAGLAGAIGVQLGRPDRKVIGVVGDGSAMYSIAALWTAAHHKIPVTWVILNNASYRVVKLNMLDYRGPAPDRQFLTLDLDSPGLRFDQIAQAFGVRGVRVEQPDALRSALKEAFAHDGPSLVDVVMEGGV